MPEDIGVGLIGYGAIGRLHALCFRMLPLVYPDLPLRPRIVAVAAASDATAARARHELGDVLATTSTDAVIRHPEVQLVDCCTPTGEHARVAQAVIIAEKALYCEKPLTASLRDSVELVGLAESHGVIGGVNYHFRQIPAVQEAVRRIASGMIGEPVSFHMRYYRASNLRADRPLNWRFSGSGAGVLLDLGSHLLDLTRLLLGPAHRITARNRTLIAERTGKDGRPAAVEGEDAVWMNLEMQNGAFGTLEASKVVAGAADDIRIELYGRNGALIFDTTDPNTLLVAGTDTGVGMQRISTLSRFTPPFSLPGPETPTSTLAWHVAALARFLEALAERRPPQPSLVDALVVDRMLAAARESIAIGGTPVDVT